MPFYCWFLLYSLFHGGHPFFVFLTFFELLPLLHRDNLIFFPFEHVDWEAITHIVHVFVISILVGLVHTMKHHIVSLQAFQIEVKF